MSTWHRFCPGAKQSSASVTLKCTLGQEPNFCYQQRFPKQVSKCPFNLHLKAWHQIQPKIIWACYCSAFMQTSEILAAPASSHVFPHTGWRWPEWDLLIIVPEKCTPPHFIINQELQPATELALRWLHYQLLSILGKKIQNQNCIKVTITYQILLQVHQAIRQLCWRTYLPVLSFMVLPHLSSQPSSEPKDLQL